MVISYGAYLGVLALVALERLVELALARRNARIAFARGAIEVGQAHYRIMAAFHTAFLVACAVEPLLLRRTAPPTFGWVLLGVAAGAQALRYWAITTLGERWNVRIIVVPDAPPVVSGPYRWVRHPNYVAVAVEMLSLPLIHGAWLTAIAFSVGNAILMVVRIRAEEAALGDRYASAFTRTPRFFPGA